MISQMLDVLDMEYSPEAAAMPAYMTPPEEHAVQRLQLQYGFGHPLDAEQQQQQQVQQQGVHASDELKCGAAGQAGGELQNIEARTPGDAAADCSASVCHSAAVSVAVASVAQQPGNESQTGWLQAAEAQGCRQPSQPVAGVHGARSIAEEWPQTDACVLANG